MLVSPSSGREHTGYTEVSGQKAFGGRDGGGSHPVPLHTREKLSNQYWGVGGHRPHMTLRKVVASLRLLTATPLAHCGHPGHHF